MSINIEIIQLNEVFSLNKKKAIYDYKVEIICNCEPIVKEEI